MHSACQGATVAVSVAQDEMPNDVIQELASAFISGETGKKAVSFPDWKPLAEIAGFCLPNWRLTVFVPNSTISTISAWVGACALVIRDFGPNHDERISRYEVTSCSSLKELKAVLDEMIVVTAENIRYRFRRELAEKSPDGSPEFADSDKLFISELERELRMIQSHLRDAGLSIELRPMCKQLPHTEGAW